MPVTKLNSQSSNLIIFPACDPRQNLFNTFISDEINNKPELVILNWLVSLPSAIDPAFAAQSILIKLNSAQRKPSSDQNSLLTLLKEISNHPREKLLDSTSINRKGQRRKNWLKRTRQRTFM